MTHPDAIPVSAFSTPDGLNEWLRMPQGAASVPACFVCVMLLTAALDSMQIFLEDATGSDDSPINYVATLAAFLARLRPHKSELSPNKTRPEPRESNSWAHVISQDGVRPHYDEGAVLPRMPMPVNIKQLRSLLDGHSYYLKPLPNMARRIRPTTTLLKPQ